MENLQLIQLKELEKRFEKKLEEFNALCEDIKKDQKQIISNLNNLF